MLRQVQGASRAWLALPIRALPHDLVMVGNSCAGSRQSGLPFPSPGDLPNPGIEPRSPALQVDTLPSESQRKPKNTGMGSLSLLQGMFLTQELNRGLLHCRWILYQLSYDICVFFPNFFLLPGINIFVLIFGFWFIFSQDSYCIWTYQLYCIF